MFMSDISIITRKMRVYAERNASSQGLGFPEQAVLMRLRAHGPSNQRTIAASMEIDKGAVAKTVAKLEEKGLVTRQVNPANKREKLVALAPAGMKLMDQMSHSYDQLEERMFAGLSDEEKSAAMKAIATIARNISDIQEA